MAVGETCGLTSTNETIDVYVMLKDYGEWIDHKWVVKGKYIVGIYSTLKGLRSAKGWKDNPESLHFEKCKLSIEKLANIILD